MRRSSAPERAVNSVARRTTLVSSSRKDYLKKRGKISTRRNKKNPPQLMCSVWRHFVPESKCNELREKRREKGNGTQNREGRGSKSCILRVLRAGLYTLSLVATTEAKSERTSKRGIKGEWLSMGSTV